MLNVITAIFRPMYIAEISTPNRRGRLISFQNWMITWGVSYH